MPLRNDGTFLEDIIITAVSSFILDKTDLDFVNSFAMPPLSTWVKDVEDPYNSVISSKFLSKLEHLPQQKISDGCDYLSLLQLCAKNNIYSGPNGALLVALLSKLKGKGIRMWLNDIAEGRYGNAIKKLRHIESFVDKMLKMKGNSIQELKVCSVKYPNSLKKLSKILNEWSMGEDNINKAIIGYLDPWYYRITRQAPNDTSKLDHQQWLKIISSGGYRLAVSVHFTANYKKKRLKDELRQMYKDGLQYGFCENMSFLLEYFAVSVSIYDKSPNNFFSKGLYAHISNSLKSYCSFNDALDLKDITVEINGEFKGGIIDAKN